MLQLSALLKTNVHFGGHGGRKNEQQTKTAFFLVWATDLSAEIKCEEREMWRGVSAPGGRDKNITSKVVDHRQFSATLASDTWNIPVITALL